MKRLLPFIFLVSAPAYADMTHNISSSVKFESLSAASTADKIGSSYSISGNNVTTVDSNSAATLGGFGSVTNGVPAVTFPSATQATSGEAFSFTQSYLEGDAVPNSAPTTGAVSNFSDLTSTAAGAIGSGAATIDNHVISVTGGDPGSSITGQYVTTLSVD